MMDKKRGGWHLSGKTRKKMREYHLGRPRPELLGKSPSPETRKLMSEHRMGNGNGNWKGGRKSTSGGYVYIYCLDHPYATGDRYVMEHRLVVEGDMKRYLMPDELVHHWNKKKDDNRPENLLVCNGSGHDYIHKRCKTRTTG